jgi:hypothetical protein
MCRSGGENIETCKHSTLNYNIHSKSDIKIIHKAPQTRDKTGDEIKKLG